MMVYINGFVTVLFPGRITTLKNRLSVYTDSSYFVYVTYYGDIDNVLRVFKRPTCRVVVS